MLHRQISNAHCERLGNARKVSNRDRRLAPSLGIAWQRKSDAAVEHWPEPALPEATAGAGWPSHSPTRPSATKIASAVCLAAASPSARRREQRPQPGRGKVCGRARRRALCARCSHLVWQLSPRAARHARTHEYIMHHTAWTACSPHVLAGSRKAVELTDNGFL